MSRIRTTRQARKCRARAIEIMTLWAIYMIPGNPKQVRCQAFLTKRAEMSAALAAQSLYFTAHPMNGDSGVGDSELIPAPPTHTTAATVRDEQDA